MNLKDKNWKQDINELKIEFILLKSNIKGCSANIYIYACVWFGIHLMCT